MAGKFEIKSGGRIRWNAPTLPGQTWERGQAIIINSGGYLQLFTGQAACVVAPALEKCVSAATGNPAANTGVVVAGGTGGILLSESVILTDNLSGAGGWIPGSSSVYAQSGGNYSYNSTSGVGVGRFIGGNPQATGSALILFRPALGF